MRLFIWLTFFIVLSFLSVTAQTQTATKDKKATGSISGKVTVRGKPASGIKIVAFQGERFEPKVVAMTSTDANGHFHLQGVPAGDCNVTVDDASFVNPKTEKGENEKDSEDNEDEDDAEDILDGIMDNAAPTQAVKAEEGEEVKGIDFDLLPGGVITGRVTEANGRPIIGEDVHIEPARDKHTPLSDLLTLHTKLRVKTDDRGIYRAFGLPLGRYSVSVGERGGEAGTYSWEKVTLPQTYYTDAVSNAKPAVIEVTSGSEATNIDIKVLRPRRAETYAIRGRVIDGLTGKPLANVFMVCRKQEATLWLSGESDSTGEFRIDKFTPGKYTISVWPYEDKSWYSDPVAFEVYGSDVSGIEIKAYRTASVSGIVIVENTNNPQVLAQLTKLKITTDRLSVAEGAQVKADGTFRIDGLQPQNQRTVFPLALQSAETWFTLSRIERNGIEQPQNIEVQAGENITDVRVVVAYHTAKIRGRITFENGSLSALSLVDVSAILTNDQQRIDALKTPTTQDWQDYFSQSKSASVDAKGNFMLEGLPPGEYQITAIFFAGRLKNLKNEKPSHPPQRLTKTVIVPADGELEINFTFDLKQPAGEKK